MKLTAEWVKIRQMERLAQNAVHIVKRLRRKQAMIELKGVMEAAIEARDRDAEEMRRKISQVAREFAEAMAASEALNL